MRCSSPETHILVNVTIATNSPTPEELHRTTEGKFGLFFSGSSIEQPPALVGTPLFRVFTRLIVSRLARGLVFSKASYATAYMDHFFSNKAAYLLRTSIFA